MKTEDVLGEHLFEFRRRKGTKDVIVMLRIISKQTLDTDEELYACFIDWQKALDQVNWIKLMQILKGASINWCERRLIRKLYTDQSVKVQLDQGQTSVKIRRGVRQGNGLSLKEKLRQGCCLSPTLFNLHSEYLTKEVWRLQNRRKSNLNSERCR
jgi:hypothetical protein